MSKVRIRLSGNWPAWNSSVRAGRMTGSNGATRQVLIHIRRDLPNDVDARARARQDGRVLSELDDPGLLRVFHVSTLEDHSAEVCEFFRAASLSTVLECLEAIGEQLPLRIAVELAAETAGVLAAVLGGTPDDDALVIHQGVGPEHVLVDDAGNVKLVGFGVLRPQDHETQGRDGYTPPEGLAPDGSAYGIGALLVNLLTDAPLPSSLSEQVAHDGVVDSLVVSILARGGEPIPDSLIRQIRSCLAYLPKDRPRLGGLANELRDLARSLPGPAIRAWAAARLPGVLMGTGLAPTPPVVQPIEPGLGGDGEETMSMGHTVRVEAALVTEESPRIQPLPVGIRQQEDALQEDEATVRLTKEEIQKHLDATQRLPLERPGLINRPVDNGTEPTVALGLSLGEEERASRLERRDGGEHGRLTPTGPSQTRGPILYIASMAIIGLLGWIAFSVLGEGPSQEASKVSADVVEAQEEVGTQSLNEVAEVQASSHSREEEQQGGGPETEEERSLESGRPAVSNVATTNEQRSDENQQLRTNQDRELRPTESTETTSTKTALPPEPSQEALPEEAPSEPPQNDSAEGLTTEPAPVTDDEPLVQGPVSEELKTSEDVAANEAQVDEDEGENSAKPEQTDGSNADEDEDLMYIAPVDEVGPVQTVPEQVEPEPTDFSVVFHSRDPDLVTLEVKCSSGFGTGPSPLTVNVRKSGPCVVRARDANGILAPRTVHVSITGPKNFYCFETGGNTCRAGS